MVFKRPVPTGILAFVLRVISEIEQKRRPAVGHSKVSASDGEWYASYSPAGQVVVKFKPSQRERERLNAELTRLRETISNLRPSTNPPAKEAADLPIHRKRRKEAQAEMKTLLAQEKRLASSVGEIGCDETYSFNPANYANIPGRFALIPNNDLIEMWQAIASLETERDDLAAQLSERQTEDEQPERESEESPS
jgi:hypothetical protein